MSKHWWAELISDHLSQIWSCAAVHQVATTSSWDPATANGRTWEEPKRTDAAHEAKPSRAWHSVAAAPTYCSLLHRASHAGNVNCRRWLRPVLLLLEIGLSLWFGTVDGMQVKVMEDQKNYLHGPIHPLLYIAGVLHHSWIYSRTCFKSLVQIAVTETELSWTELTCCNPVQAWCYIDLLNTDWQHPLQTGLQVATIGRSMYIPYSFCFALKMEDGIKNYQFLYWFKFKLVFYIKLYSAKFVILSLLLNHFSFVVVMWRRWSKFEFVECEFQLPNSFVKCECCFIGP